MKVENFSEVSFTINPKFIKRYPWLNKEDIARSILAEPWNLPTLDSRFYLTGMGTTRNEAAPSGINFNGKEIGIFAKPAEVEMARREFQNSKIARQRGINTPLLLALWEQADLGIVIGKLMHTVESLSARNLDYGLVDPRVYRPLDMLRDFVEFIADFHNRGLVHGDLHLGNLGYQYRDKMPPRKILFDLETAFVLGDYELSLKNHDQIYSEEMADRMDIFEQIALNDLGTFLAYLSDRHFPMPQDELLKQADIIYQAQRSLSYGLSTGQDFTEGLSKEYGRVLKQLQRLDEIPPA